MRKSFLLLFISIISEIPELFFMIFAVLGMKSVMGEYAGKYCKDRTVIGISGPYGMSQMRRDPDQNTTL